MLKKTVVSVLALIAMVLCSLVPLSGCGPKNDDETSEGENKGGVRDYIENLYKMYEPTLGMSSDRIEIGVKDVQKWVFVKAGSGWLFDGVYAIADGKPDRVFVGSSGKLDENGDLRKDGYYFTVASTSDENGIDKQIKGLVTDISVKTNNKDEKSIVLKGKGFESTLTATKRSQFVERCISVKPNETLDIRDGDISFVLRGEAGEFSEYGYILSRKTEDTQYSLPYSFPAIAGKLTRLKDSSKVFTYINVIDYNNTDECFKTARRRIGLNDFFEEGILSTEGTLDNDNAFIERVCVRRGNNDSFYDMIYDARHEYGAMYDLDIETLIAANGNMNVYDWDVAAYGATYDLIDSRGRPFGDDVGTWGPYGYQNGGAESFGSMNILKGMVRYALNTGDDKLLEFAMKYALQMVTPDPVYGKCYVMPLSKEAKYAKYNNNDYYFFRGCYNNGAEYDANDTYVGGDQFLSFKYYSRVSQLGEIALLTGNKTLKTAYLNLMTFVKRLRTADFAQAVEWDFNGNPKLDYENGGSSGSEAMWANCMYIASRLTDDAAEKSEYLDFMKRATDLANKQGFSRSSSLRNSPKPESVGYMVRANIVLYKNTGDKSYLNYALTAAQGIYFFYYHNTNPYTYFQTVGYGYACAHERWEAFMEMVESLELLVGVFEYYDDPLLYELYFTLRESALTALPVNGYPEGILGSHSDWLDALFVPFEQPTGVLGDNGLSDGGAASYRRWSKELYGMGEIYLGAMMFSTQGKAADTGVLVINYTSVWLECSRRKNAYKLYNFGATGDKIVSFPNYDQGTYTVRADGKEIGNYTDTQLSNGIAVNLKKEVPVRIEIIPSNGTGSEQMVNKKTYLSVGEVQSDSAVITVSADDATHYRLYVSRTGDFNGYTTSIKLSEKNVFEIGFEDASSLYVKAVAFDKNGKPYQESAVTTIDAPNVKIGAQDDFASRYLNADESQTGWTAESLNYSGSISFGTDLGDLIDYPSGSTYRDPTGYMAVYKPKYAGYDVDTFTKTYRVDLSEYPLFDFYPFTKNFGSKFSLKVETGGKTYTLIDKTAGFKSPNYRFDLSEITGETGVRDVKVIIVSEGRNRGFALTKLRFVKETAHVNYDLITNFENAQGEVNVNADGMLVIENGTGLSFFNEYSLPLFTPSEYKKMEISLNGITEEQNGLIKAKVTITERGADTPAYIGTFANLSSDSKISVAIADANLVSGKYYAVKLTFTVFGVQVDNIGVKSVRVISDMPDETIAPLEEGLIKVVAKDKNGKYELINGWKNNWAMVNPKTGYIYNGNPNVGYGSISNTALIDLEKTPVLRFKIGDIKGNDVSWAFKANDGMMATDMLLKQSTANIGTGVFEVNLKDAFGRSGIINLRLDLYVLHGADENKGVRFDGVAFLKGKDLYNNAIEGAYSVTESRAFTINTDINDYLVLDIPKLTYGEKWIAYLVDENGTEYELKTVYEKVYSKMYSRSKEGIFKYKLTDVVPEALQGKDAKFTLKIILGGEETQIVFGSIRLANDNDTPVLQQSCKIR